MKQLKDLCLDCLALNLSGNITSVSRGLAPVHKELLLERLMNHDRLTTDYLPHITYNLVAATMRHLVINRCAQVRDDLLQLVSFSGCKLTCLTITGCKSVTNVGLASVMKGQNELEVVKLKYFPQLTVKGLSTLCSPVLHTLNLKATGVTSEAVAVVLKNNQSVRHLVISMCKNLDHTVVSMVADCLGTNLETLEARDVYTLDDSGIVHLSNCCPNLTKLNLHGNNRVSADALSQVFVNCPTLYDVDLSFCTRLTGCDVMIDMPLTVRILSLCGLQLVDAAGLVDAVRRLTNLRVIRLCGVPAVTDDSLEQMLAGVGERLEVLDLSGGLTMSLTDEALSSAVRHCPSLSGLHLSMHKDITGASLLPLLREPQRAKKLRHLTLSCKQLSSDVLDCVSRHCSSIELLELSGVMYVDDLFLCTVADHCRRLRHIGIKGCRQVTDEGICALSRGCPDLKSLILSGVHELTDRSIIALANGCPHIAELYMSGCSMITRAAIRYLVDKCVPRVHWEHRVPNVDPEMLMVHNLDTDRYCRVDQQL